MLQRSIPSSGELIPVVGIGTWLKFDIGNNKASRSNMLKILNLLLQHGGKLIDTSPMYGSAEEVIGDLTSATGQADKYFYATKVWTTGKKEGIEQMKASIKKLRHNPDLMQIHNLVDWKTHLKTLRQWKEEGIIRYIGITHYQDAAHTTLQQIIKSEKIDFVQFNYSILSRNAEKGLLNTALEKEVAVIINEPLDKGDLFKKVKEKAFPQWAMEHDIKTWTQFFLKYIIAHPAVTIVIPATSDPLNLLDNLSAGKGKLPDEALRKKMVDFMEEL